jgi:hypothetical protein
VWAAKWWTWNFNRELQGNGWDARGFVTFLNYWDVGSGVSGSWRVGDDRLTRGGPAAILPARWSWNVNFNSDSRKWLSVSGGTNRLWTDQGGWVRNGNLSLNFKPSPKLTLSTGPQWNEQWVIAQYVRSVPDPTAAATHGGRYVFGNLSQKQLTMTTRVNVILTPKISIQVFAQPLVAAGDYQHFKELAAARTFDFHYYGTAGSRLSFDDASSTYQVDPDGAGAALPFTFRDPDFNLKSLRVNAVFRWELKPGSTFYAVWTRQQQDYADPGQFSFGRDTAALFSAPGDDIFLVKMAYWIGR